MKLLCKLAFIKKKKIIQHIEKLSIRKLSQKSETNTFAGLTDRQMGKQSECNKAENVGMYTFQYM